MYYTHIYVTGFDIAYMHHDLQQLHTENKQIFLHTLKTYFNTSNKYTSISTIFTMYVRYNKKANRLGSGYDKQQYLDTDDFHWLLILF